MIRLIHNKTSLVTAIAVAIGLSGLLCTSCMAQAAAEVTTAEAAPPTVTPVGFFDGFFGGVRGRRSAPANEYGVAQPVQIDPWLQGQPASEPLVYPTSIAPTPGFSGAPVLMGASQVAPRRGAFSPQLGHPSVACVGGDFYLPSRLYGDLLYLHATGIDMAHAQQQVGLGGIGVPPRGVIGVADLGYEAGFRVGGGLALAPQSRLNVAYTFYDSGTSQSTSPPGIAGGAAASLVHHPAVFAGAAMGTVTANYSVDFQTAEINYEHLLRHSKNGQLSYLVGLRYANLEQDFSQSGAFAGNMGGNVITSTALDFEGFGPMVGVEGQRQLGDTYLFVYGRSSLAAISGEFSGVYRMFSAPTELALATLQDDRIVPVLDYEIGVGWRSYNDRLSVSVGYLSSFWFNVISTPVFIDAVQANNYVNIDDTIAFDGFTARAEWNW